LTYSYRAHLGPGVDTASNKNEHQVYLLGSKGGRFGWLKTLPLLFPNCHEIW